MSQVNFNDLKHKLTNLDVDQLVILIGHGCRHKTKVRIRSILTYGWGSVGSFGIYNRLIKEGGKWDYIAGQSYSDEIRTLRDCILGKVY